MALPAILESPLAAWRENTGLKWLPEVSRDKRLPELSPPRSLVKSRARTAHAGAYGVHAEVSGCDPGSLAVAAPSGSHASCLRSSRLWGGACLGLPPRPAPPRNAWPFKADRAGPNSWTRGGGGMVTWAAGGATRGSARCGAPGAAAPALAGLPPGALPSGTRSPGTPSPGPLSLLFPGPRGYSGSAFLLLISARA